MKMNSLSIDFPLNGLQHLPAEHDVLMTQGFSIKSQIDFLFCAENRSEFNSEFILRETKKSKKHISLTIEEIQTKKTIILCVYDEIIIVKKTLAEVKRKKNALLQMVKD